jgi:hypothetical protein
MALSTYTDLKAAVADWLNRGDLTTTIPQFVDLATARIQRDMVRAKHPYAMTRSQASVVQNYSPMPNDFVAMFQLMDQDTTQVIDYLSPEQTKQILSAGYTTASVTGARVAIYYTIIGNRLRIIPTPGATSPTTLDMWYYNRITPLSATVPQNWVLTRYPDLYLYGTLVHSAPWLKADDRLAVWEGAYQNILKDIEVEADRAVRSQSKLVAARRGF